MNKTNSWLTKLLRMVRNGVSKLNVTGKIMRWIAWYIGIILLSTALYLIGWGVLWYKAGLPNIVELRYFLHEIVSAPWIAMVGAIAQYFVDKDHNNIPDILEQRQNNRYTVSKGISKNLDVHKKEVDNSNESR